MTALIQYIRKVLTEWVEATRAVSSVLRQFFSGNKLSKSEWQHLAYESDKLALPAMLSGYLLGGVGGIGLVMIVLYIPRWKIAKEDAIQRGEELRAAQEQAAAAKKRADAVKKAAKN